MPSLPSSTAAGRTDRVWAALLPLALAFWAVTARAQASAGSAPVAQGGTELGSIRGTVIDSIRDGVLVHAIVDLVVADTSKHARIRETRSDALGRFQFDSVTPDVPYNLHVLHPLLDTVGIDLWTSSPLAVRPGQARLYDIYTPTPGRIVGQLCGKSNNFWRGVALLTGFVRDPDTDKPLDSADVSYEYTASRPGSTVTLRDGVVLGGIVDSAVRRWSVDSETATGRYRICGLPADAKGTLQIVRKGIASAEIQVDMKGDLLVLRSLGVSRSAVATQVKSDSGHMMTVVKGAAQLKGRVQDRSGKPVKGAHVDVAGTLSAADTRPDGTFTLDSLPAGTQLVDARMVGFNPYQNPVDLKTGAENQVTITMPDFVPTLPAITTVSDRQRSLDRIGFTTRKKQAINGFFYEGDQVVRGAKISEAFKNIPGFQVARCPVAQSYVNQNTTINCVQWKNGADMPGGSCVNYFIDRQHFVEASPGDIDNVLDPQNVEAIEAYPPIDTPMEFQQMGLGNCATIVIWTTQEIKRHIGPGGS